MTLDRFLQMSLEAQRAWLRGKDWNDPRYEDFFQAYSMRKCEAKHGRWTPMQVDGVKEYVPGWWCVEQHVKRGRPVMSATVRAPRRTPGHSGRPRARRVRRASSTSGGGSSDDGPGQPGSKRGRP
jgi:hypothetical protein